jgi:ATP-binding cassette subfamily B protein
MLAASVQLLAGCATAFGLLSTVNVFSQLLVQGPTPQRVLAALPALAVVVVAHAASGLLAAASGGAEAALGPRIEYRAQDALFHAVLGVDLVAFDDADFNDLVKRAADLGLPRVRDGIRDVGELTASLVSMAAAVVTAAVLHPLLAPAVLLAAAPQGWAGIRNAKLAFGSFVRMASWMRRLAVTGALITARRDAAEVRAFTTQDALLAEHRRIASGLAAESIQVERRKTANLLAGRTLSGLGTGLAYGTLGLLMYTGSLPLALGGAALIAMRTAASAVSRTVLAGNSLYERGFYLELYRNCLTDAAHRRRQSPTARVHGDPRVVELTGVTFRYPGQQECALDEVSLVLRRGQVTALVGENGSGKSTLAKLITGLYLPESGQVTWDGVDTATVDPGSLHSRVAVVMQNPTQWPMTVANNIRIGRLERADPTGELLADAAARSGADVVIDELALGWDTLLSRDFQSGRDLSGGQWQRISVARGLFRDAPLVVADEPTSAMDARAEHAVFTALRMMSQSSDNGTGRTISTGDAAGRITVLVTHRLANIRHADQIVVLERGRVIECGTHDDLMTRRGSYYELFSLQARAYTDQAAPPKPGPKVTSDAAKASSIS